MARKTAPLFTTVSVRRHTKRFVQGTAPVRKSPYPVLVFSHGLIGHCNTHSASLSEPASRGIACEAPEHRHGSGSITLVQNGEVGEAR